MSREGEFMVYATEVYRAAKGLTGRAVVALFALVFRRRVPDFVVKYASLTFMVLLMGLMGLLILRDGWRSWKIHTYQPDSSSSGDSITTNESQNATGQGR